MRPRQTRNSVANRIALVTGITGIVMATGGSAGATPYNITTNSMADDPTDKVCTFWEAVQAVNLHSKSTQYHECKVWDGTDDVITLPTNAPNNWDFTANAPITLERSVTIQSATRNVMVPIVQGPGFVGGELFNIDIKATPAAIKLTDLYIVGSDFGLVTGIGGGDTLSNGGDDMVTLTRCWVQYFDASGIGLDSVSLTLQDSAIDSNEGDSSGGPGSGVFMESQSQSLTHLVMNNSSITANNGDGGIYLELARGSVSNITNSTISDNGGMGISLFDETGTSLYTVNIIGSTIAFNYCSGVGKDCGIANDASANSQHVVLQGTVVGGNVTFGGVASNYSGLIYKFQDSLLETSNHATFAPHAKSGTYRTDYGATNLDPTLADNGGRGNWHPMTHKPLSNSICVDFLPNTNILARTSDQRYQSRPVDYPNRGPNTYDVGAIELKQTE